MTVEEDASGAVQLVLIASVELEIEPVRRRLHDMRTLLVGRKPAWSGSLAGRPVLLVACGMGKTNAAHAVTAALEGHAPRALLNFGVGGAYPLSGLGPADLALATVERYADEGVEGPAGWLSPREMGIPLVRDGEGELFDEFPVDAALTRSASAALEEADLPHRCGPFATVSTCSGTTERGRRLAARTGALVESMEGAACAHLCRIYGVPFVEVRAISNLVEDRDLSRWRLHDAAERAGRAVEQIVACW